MTGGPNEVWSYGPEAGAIVEEYPRLRERLKPYVPEQMRGVPQSGADRGERVAVVLGQSLVPVRP